MSRRPRRNHSAAFKAKVAIEALADGKTIAEIAQKHDVHPNQVTEWRRQLMERALEVSSRELGSMYEGLQVATDHRVASERNRLQLVFDSVNTALSKSCAKGLASGVVFADDTQRAFVPVGE